MMNDSTRTAGAGSEPGKLRAITGHPRVEEALAGLAGLDELPGSGHVEAYEHVDKQLHGLLDDLDTSTPGAAAPGRPVPPAHAVSRVHPDGQAEQA